MPLGPELAPLLAFTLASTTIQAGIQLALTPKTKIPDLSGDASENLGLGVDEDARSRGGTLLSPTGVGASQVRLGSPQLKLGP